MPSVKIARKSTDTDMTPFVDVAFLILAFFMLATKFKPPDPVEITTPNSVSSDALEQKDGILVQLDKDGRVFFAMQTDVNRDAKRVVIENLNKTRNLGLTAAEMSNFEKAYAIGVPFNQLKQFLALDDEGQKKVKQPGIPVKDSATNELYYWVRDAVTAFAGTGSKISYLIKGDNAAKYPDFKRVLEAFKRNDIYKFQLVTSPESAPPGTELYKTRQGGSKPAAN